MRPQEHAHFLSGGSRDVEPLVDAGVDWRRGHILVLGDVKLAVVGAVFAVWDRGVGAVRHMLAC